MIISKDVSFYLYGYTFSAREAYEALLEAGYCVLGYIDKNAELYKDKCDIPIYSTDDLESLEKANALVIIFLRNVVSHEAVAEFLAGKGFLHILYLPSAMNLVSRHENRLRNMYNLLSAGYAAEMEGESIPAYRECFYPRFDVSKSICSETANTIVVRCPWVLAYSSTLEWRMKEDVIKRGIETPWEENDIPIIAQKLYSGLIEYHRNMSKSTSEVDGYLEHRKTQLPYREKASVEIELANRIMVLDVMEEKFGNGLEYFENAPAEAIWNAKGYFNIVDGMHRSHFLMARGMKYVPVRISKEGYWKWYNITALKKCIRYIEEYDIKKSKVPIPHPAFYSFESEKKWKHRTILECILRRLYMSDLSGKRMLEISDYNSYFARNLCRRGVALAVSYEPVKELREFAELLNELLYTQDVVLVSDIEAVDKAEKYQIVCIINPDENYVSQEMVVDIINKHAEGVVFWQSRTEKYQAEKEDILNRTTFKYYKCIFNGYNGKCMAEFGVFSTNPDFTF